MHQPVMLKEVIDFLNLKPGDVVLDATVGLAGHAKGILGKILPGGKLIGIDADPSTLEVTDKALKDYKGSYALVNDNFRNLDAILSREGIKSLSGALFDLGISSYQIDGLERGFSIKHQSPLDMRMDPKGYLTAHDIVNEYDETELDEIIEKFGEERFHARIARYIVEERARNTIETTHDLANVICKAVGSRYMKSRIHPATRTFQALRIAVNDELGALEKGLKQVVSWMDVGARLCIISFHSLEDRIVKNLFKGYAALGMLKIITKKCVRPSRAEEIANPRSRSAKLRVSERM